MGKPTKDWQGVTSGVLRFLLLGVGLGVYLREEHVKFTQLRENEEISQAKHLAAPESKAHQLVEKLQDERKRMEGLLREEVRRREETEQRVMKLEEEIKRLNQALAAKAERGEKTEASAEGFPFHPWTPGC